MGYDKSGIGNRIYSARINKNLKQSDMSKRLGISQSAYSNIESGKVDITLSRLYQLSDILEVPVTWILGENSIDELTDAERLELDKFMRYIINIRHK